MRTANLPNKAYINYTNNRPLKPTRIQPLGVSFVKAKFGIELGDT